MKTKRLTFYLVVATTVFLCGCAGSAMQVGTHKYPPVNPESVQVLYQEPSKRYEVIAFVDQQGSGFDFSANSTIAGLKEQAAKVGADAVIVTSAKPMKLYEYAHTSGKAIKWTSKEGKGHA